MTSLFDKILKESYDDDEKLGPSFDEFMAEEEANREQEEYDNMTPSDEAIYYDDYSFMGFYTPDFDLVNKMIEELGPDHIVSQYLEKLLLDGNYAKAEELIEKKKLVSYPLYEEFDDLDKKFNSWDEFLKFLRCFDTPEHVDEMIEIIKQRF